MKKEEKVAEVKDLLNQIIVLAGKSKDEFLNKAANYAAALLSPPIEEDEDLYDSDYYDSNC